MCSMDAAVAAAAPEFKEILFLLLGISKRSETALKVEWRQL